MKVTVASKNPIKVDAVRETIKDYDLLRKADVVSIEVDSGVPAQPKSLEETIYGAMNRAKNSFNGCDYSFGIEAGLMTVPWAKTGSMNVTACAIHDGTKYHIGLSSAFEFPPVVTKMIYGQGLEVDEAFFRGGLTNDPKIGSSEGAISVLTNGRLNRKDYTKQAIQMAMIHLENSKLYET